MSLYEIQFHNLRKRKTTYRKKNVHPFVKS